MNPGIDFSDARVDAIAIRFKIGLDDCTMIIAIRTYSLYEAFRKTTFFQCFNSESNRGIGIVRLVDGSTERGAARCWSREHGEIFLGLAKEIGQRINGVRHHRTHDFDRVVTCLRLRIFEPSLPNFMRPQTRSMERDR